MSKISFKYEFVYLHSKLLIENYKNALHENKCCVLPVSSYERNQGLYV